MSNRVVKSADGISITERTLSDGQKVFARAYAVASAADPTLNRTFGDMGEAEAYFEELRRLNPPKA
jgi:hypothetical protein